MCSLWCFNPTLVRLRHPDPYKAASETSEFQSHAGSIEASPMPRQTLGLEGRFNPTLVRLRRQARVRGPQGGLRFNPTLVRLRPAMGQPPDRPGHIWFQSHAGSIEAPGRRWGFALDPLFQSHAGSIEARGICSSVTVACSCFNPTLVRLRPWIVAGFAAED